MVVPALSEAQDSVYARHLIADLASPQMYGRGCAHRGDSIAADYIRGEFCRWGVAPLAEDYFQPFVFEKGRSTPPVIAPGYRSQNVCGMVRGRSDSVVVFAAHYDHLGMSGDTLFPGAHDNASGTAAVLDLARQFAADTPYYTIVFMLFGGEEAGLVGSRFAASHPLFDYSLIRLFCNIDMFCGGDEGLMVVNANDSATRGFVARMESADSADGLPFTVKHRDNAPNSDHYWFSAFCPAIFIYTLGGPYGGYHSPEDTCEGCGLAHYEAFLKRIKTVALP